MLGRWFNKERNYLLCRRAASGLVQALEKYDEPNLPLNIGFGTDLLIKDLANKIAKISGFNGNIIWDKTKPTGQKRKILSNIRMSKYNIFLKDTPLDIALDETLKWYKKWKMNKI